MTYLLTKANRYRIESLTCNNELYYSREQLKKYWQAPYNVFKNMGIVTNHNQHILNEHELYDSTPYSQSLISIVRCQLTNKLIRTYGSYPLMKNVYGHNIYTTQEILIRLGYKWIDNLQTYMHESDLECLEYEHALNSDCTNTTIIMDERLFDCDLWSDYKWSEYNQKYLHDSTCMFDHTHGDYITISQFNDRYDNVCRDCEEHVDDCTCNNEDYPQLSSYERCALNCYGYIDTRNKNLFFSRQHQSTPLSKNTRYYGLEIELHLDSASNVTKLRNELESDSLALGCSDGSLSDVVGIEIKTPPLQSGNVLKTYLKEIYSYINRYNTDTSNGMGLHVNISRSSVSNLTIGKLQTFIHNPHNFEFIKYIARRHSEQWSDFSTRKTLMSDFNKSYGYMSEDKYTALNIKKHVLEFRLFKTCENYEQAITSCELCDSLIAFVQTIPYQQVHKHGIKFEDYIKFLENRKTWWTHAHAYVFKKYVHVQYEMEQILIHSVR